MAHSPIRPDRTVPALIVKISEYPWHHGGVGAIRSLGRLDIPVYAITEGPRTPAAMSRHLRDSFVWPTTGLEEPAWLVEGLLDIGRRIGRPAVLIPTDDEAAVLISEHQADLADTFLFPRIEASLPRQLASKRGLQEICMRNDVETARASFPTTQSEASAVVENLTFPLVAKSQAVFERHRSGGVDRTTRIDDAEQLVALARTWGEEFDVTLQEYLPCEDAEDWIVHAYCDASSTCVVEFTGVKLRSWPPHAGFTTCALSVPNDELADIAARLVRSIGFRGILDLDFRYDRRDGKYKLLDFNPRVGAQFRLFETGAGIDVVRALHLDLTGREVPAGNQIDGRRFVLENFDPLARIAYRHSVYVTPSAPSRTTSTELAWLAKDDVRPSLGVLAWTIRAGAGNLLRRLRTHRR